ncbi:MAG: bifunctional o-acetylhomoserine/o-acetylserine sulfhydrylase [Acidimicrobiales bacterium]|nr:bifunctional o-acetylhomoserine/o-acetylserine sulfhydrylase [Acidimicrobiales bacterium]
MSNNGWGFETRQIHAGWEPDPTTGARVLPIYQTTAFSFRDSAHGAALFALTELGNIYTRIMNPTQQAFELRVAALENAPESVPPGLPAALAVSSGQQAETVTMLTLCEAGDHIVTSSSLYGGTYNLFHYTLPKLGISVDFIDDVDDLSEWEAKIQDNTKVLYGETIGNPKNDVFPLQDVGALGQKHGIPLVVDNTVATPFLLNPLDHGANIVVHSATKFLGGHGNSIGGVIVDGANFDFGASGRFPNFTTPDPSYHGMNYWEMLGAGCFIVKARLQMLRDLGGAISPFNAFLFVQGIETLSLRMERHVSNAQRVAEYLEQHDQVESVQYAGLPSSPWYERAQKLLPRGASAVPAFVIKGGAEAGEKFTDALQLHSNLANIGDVRSLVIHPASTTHQQLTPEEQAATGVSPGLIRLSVGIESIDDILADLDIGFAAAKA